MRPDATLILAALALAPALAACAREPVVETEPVALTEPTFQYPEELWDAGVEGRTILRIHITEGGGVDSALVERSSGYPPFDSAALAGADDLRFEPARRNGTPVPRWVLLPVEFSISAPQEASDTAAEPDPDLP
jgi:periplasmic protein TonB